MHEANNSDEQSFDESHSSSESLPSVSTAFSRLRKAKDKATSKAKNSIARLTSQALDEDRNEDEIVADTLDDPAFIPNSSQRQDAPEQGPIDKVKSAAKSTAKALVHPKRALQSKAKQAAAGKISDIHKPHTLSSHTEDLVDAHEDLDSSSFEESEHTRQHDVASRLKNDQKRSRIDRLKAEGESRQIAWTTEHIDRVRVVSTKERTYPNRQDYYQTHAGDHLKFDFPQWIGHFALWYTQGFTAPYVDDFDALPFDLQTFRSHAERLAVATIPWQIWAMDVRSVYRWERPWRTARWLVASVFFWYFEYVATFFWGSILYYTIHNKLYPQSAESLRTSMQRADNHNTAAYGFAEFVDRHGDKDWLDPLIDQLGPYVQLQLYDLVNLIEVLANFYSWRVPRYTIGTLLFCASCLALAALTELRYTLKLFWLIVGGGFFLCWPIASLYPRYRILVSPLRWIVWDIPTSAERSFTYLSQQCQETRSTVLDKELNQDLEETTEDQSPKHSTEHATSQTKDSPNDDSSSTSSFHSVGTSTSSVPSHILAKPLLSYRCLYSNRPGRIHITPNQIHFTSSLKRHNRPFWTLRYTSLVEMRKYKRTAGSAVEKHSRSKHEGCDRVLELEDKDGVVYTLDIRDRRDQVFNYILGFSGAAVRWRNLQC